MAVAYGLWAALMSALIKASSQRSLLNATLYRADTQPSSEEKTSRFALKKSIKMQLFSSETANCHLLDIKDWNTDINIGGSFGGRWSERCRFKGRAKVMGVWGEDRGVLHWRPWGIGFSHAWEMRIPCMVFACPMHGTQPSHLWDATIQCVSDGNSLKTYTFLPICHQNCHPYENL